MSRGKKVRRKRAKQYVCRIPLGITAELDELLTEYSPKYNGNDLRCMIFEAVSAMLLARENGSPRECFPVTRLDVVPGLSHWQTHCAADRAITCALRTAVNLADAEMDPSLIKPLSLDRMMRESAPPAQTDDYDDDGEKWQNGAVT